MKALLETLKAKKESYESSLRIARDKLSNGGDDHPHASSRKSEVSHFEGAIVGIDAAIKEAKGLDDNLGSFSNMLNDCIVGKQSAWIEWRHGKGAEAAMGWIENSLFGPGLIPSETEKHSTNAQFWYDTNNSSSFPECFCGNLSHQLWMGKGACCNEHMKQIKATTKSSS